MTIDVESKMSFRSVFRVPIRAFSSRAERSMLSGAPEKFLNRRVIVYQRPKHAMSSGVHHTKEWKLKWESDEKWTNTLMGWTSSRDPLIKVQNQMAFPSKEAAVAFVKENGWEPVISEPGPQKELEPKSYADNFKHRPLHNPRDPANMELQD